MAAPAPSHQNESEAHLPVPEEIAALPPLTAEQQRIVTAELHLYFSHFYLRGYPYQRPTFRAIKRYYARDELPDDVSAGQVARGAPHHVSDPTPAAAFEAMYGPPMVAVWQGEREPVDVTTFRRLKGMLPTHLLVPFDLVIERRLSYIEASGRVQGIGRETMSAYVHAAMRCIAQALYAERWVEGAA